MFLVLHESVRFGPPIPKFTASDEHLLKILAGAAFGNASERFEPSKDNFERIHSKEIRAARYALSEDQNANYTYHARGNVLSNITDRLLKNRNLSKKPLQ